MNRFQELQDKHVELLRRYETNKDSADFIKDVREYTEQVLNASREISDSRERNQLRANLRFWGAYIYDHTGVYPNLSLLPSEGKAEAAARPTPPLPRQGITIAIILLLAIIGLGGFLILRGINRPYSQQPAATYTPIELTSLFATPVGQTPSMTDVEAFGTATALALTGIPIVAATPTPVSINPMLITIPDGQTTAARIGIVNPQEKVRYALNAMEGQTLNLRLTGAGNEIGLAVYAPDGTVLKPRDTIWTWVQTVSFSGDYVIEVSNDGAQSAAYTLDTSLLTSASGFVPQFSYSEPTCIDRTIELAWRDFKWDTSELSGSPEIEEASAYLSLLGTGDIVSQVNIIPNGEPTLLRLGEVASDESYLLQVRHPLFLFEPIIIQFTSDCAYNDLSIVYGGQSNIIDESTMDVELTLMDWGPDQLIKDDSWTAELSINQDEGGIYRYEYSPINEKTFFVSGLNCSTSPFTLSRLSNGNNEGVLLYLYLAGPLCPKTE